MGKRAIQSFAFPDPADPQRIAVVSDDDEYDDDHPFVKARPAMFRDIQDNPYRIKAPGRVEQATAAPGEGRNVRKS